MTDPQTAEQETGEVPTATEAIGVLSSSDVMVVVDGIYDQYDLLVDDRPTKIVVAHPIAGEGFYEVEVSRETVQGETVLVVRMGNRVFAPEGE